MSRPIEDIERDIKATKEVISEKQGDLVRLKKEFCEAMSVKFTEDTGINEGDKFKCTTTYRDYRGKESAHCFYGFFLGFGLSNWGSVSLVYADVKKDGTRSKNIHNTSLSVEDFHQYEKV